MATQEARLSVRDAMTHCWRADKHHQHIPRPPSSSTCQGRLQLRCFELWSETRQLKSQHRKSLDSLGEAAGWKWFPHCFQLSGYPNTTHHENIPPRIGPAGSWLWISESPVAEAEGNRDKPKRGAPVSGWVRWLITVQQHSRNTVKWHRDSASKPMALVPWREGKRERKRACREKLPRFPSYPAFLLPTAVEKSETQPRLNLRQSRGRNITPERWGKGREGTHGSFHVSGESWARSRSRAAEAAEWAASSPRSCLDCNEPSWASSQDV